jgi:hypothetical protein
MSMTAAAGAGMFFPYFSFFFITLMFILLTNLGLEGSRRKPTYGDVRHAKEGR